MPTTSKGFRYPASSAAPNIPQDFQNLASDVDAYLYPTAGVSRGTLSFYPGFQQAVGFGVVSYFRDASGLIHMGGMASNVNGMSGAVTVPIVGLPAGYRPAHTCFFAVPVNMGTTGVSAHVNVQTNGDLVVVRTPAVDANLLWDLSSIVFHPGV